MTKKLFHHHYSNLCSYLALGNLPLNNNVYFITHYICFVIHNFVPNDMINNNNNQQTLFYFIIIIWVFRSSFISCRIFPTQRFSVFVQICKDVERYKGFHINLRIIMYLIYKLFSAILSLLVYICLNSLESLY